MVHKTRLGPIAVFLTIVAMVITTLALLTVATSNADRVMAGRFANITQTRYELEADGERFIAAVAAGNAESMEGVTAGSSADAEDAAAGNEAAGAQDAEGNTEAAGNDAAGAQDAEGNTESAGNVYSYVAEKDGYRLEVEAGMPDDAGNVEIRKWKLSRIWKSSDPLEDIWQGF